MLLNEFLTEHRKVEEFKSNCYKAAGDERTAAEANC